MVKAIENYKEIGFNDSEKETVGFFNYCSSKSRRTTQRKLIYFQKTGVLVGDLKPKKVSR